MSELSVRLADWQQDHAELCRIRETVFISEQAVPAELEWGAEDLEAQHFLAEEAGYAIGTARLSADGYISRVAVLKDWRGMHVGLRLMQKVLAVAEERGLPELKLTAQVHAIPFYERLGFTVVSDEYLDAGIPHVDMIRTDLSKA